MLVVRESISHHSTESKQLNSLNSFICLCEKKIFGSFHKFSRNRGSELEYSFYGTPPKMSARKYWHTFLSA